MSLTSVSSNIVRKSHIAIWMVRTTERDVWRSFKEGTKQEKMPNTAESVVRSATVRIVILSRAVIIPSQRKGEVNRREAMYTYEIPFVVMLVSATAIPKTAEDVSNSNSDSQSNRALTHSCQVYGFSWVIMCG